MTELYAPIDLRAEAERASRIAAEKGWQRSSWDENFLAKLTLVRGELDEATDAALSAMDRSRPTRDDSVELHTKYGHELADVAIRLLTIIHDIWGDDWAHASIEQRPPMTFGPFCEPDVLFRPMRRSLRSAEEQWRKGTDASKDFACGALEDALGELFGAASASCVWLGHAIRHKQSFNGKGRDLG